MGVAVPQAPVGGWVPKVWTQVLVCWEPDISKTCPTLWALPERDVRQWKTSYKKIRVPPRPPPPLNDQYLFNLSLIKVYNMFGVPIIELHCFCCVVYLTFHIFEVFVTDNVNGKIGKLDLLF